MTHTFKTRNELALVMPQEIIASLDPKRPIEKQGDVLTINLSNGEQRSGKNSWGFLGVYFGGRDNVPASITAESVELAKVHARELRKRAESKALKSLREASDKLSFEQRVQRLITHFELIVEGLPTPLEVDKVKDAALTTAKRAELVGFMPFDSAVDVLKGYARTKAA